MGASGGRALLITTALVASCTTTTRRVTPTSPTSALGTPDMIQALARQALLLDASGDHAADTLYAPEALVVANAHVRLASPRFAGVGYGGRVTVATASVTLQGRVAWVLVDYRWINAERGLAEAGRATFICEQNPKGWRIVHVHSSQLLPWDR